MSPSRDVSVCSRVLPVGSRQSVVVGDRRTCGGTAAYWIYTFNPITGRKNGVRGYCENCKRSAALSIARLIGPSYQYKCVSYGEALVMEILGS